VSEQTHLATAPVTAATGSTRRARTEHLPGEEGVWVLIFGDMAIFAVFFCTYLYYRAQQVSVFATSQGTLNRTYGLINTLLLLTSSLGVSIGVRALRGEAWRLGRLMFSAALLCGAGFVAMKAVEWGHEIHLGVTPQTNSFFMFYFILTGLHLFHVLIGLCVLVFLVTQARGKSLTPRRLALVEGGACFWHMVDLLWIVLFPLLYLAR
jgi:nitric oxide reductase NorE protein